MRPLQPTPPPAVIHARLKVESGLAPERVLAAVDPFAAGLAAQLHREGRQARRLQMQVRWECGCSARDHRTLHQHTADVAVLAGGFRRLLVALLQAYGEHSAAVDGGTHTQVLDGLWVAASDFAPILPCQATFWRTRDQRLSAAHRTAETLVRRHGRPLLRCVEATQPAAIFEEECHRFTDLPGAELAGIGSCGRTSVVNQLASASAVGADPWQAVPQRLHWW